MGVAADCTYTERYGSEANATQQILVNWNSASALYRNTFRVSLGIVELQVMKPNCPTAADPAVPWNVDCGDVTLNDRLSLFSQWRGNKGSDGTGLWHLLSRCTTGSEVGIAWLATLCVPSRLVHTSPFNQFVGVGARSPPLGTLPTLFRVLGSRPLEGQSGRSSPTRSVTILVRL